MDGRHIFQFDVETQNLASLRIITAREPAFRGVLERLGPPPLWARTPGFATLVHMILEQQVSLASARAAFDRLRLRLGEVAPGPFLSLDDAELLAIGFSRQKAGYCRGLARMILSGELDLEALERLDDEAVRRALLRVKGIGPWTAEVYLLMALLRPDAWPKGDLALAQAAKDLFNLSARPGPEELERLAETWRPYRAAAARLLWNHYLNPLP
jgi:DNA-3-methyladenine glycosylase II